jgi:uncharacterized protein YndB with AHSA1/START domain
MKADQNSSSADREIVITRVLNAPRKLVFKAWTDPEHLINWWGPNGFTNTFHEIDIKPGSIWSFTMHGPDGTNYPNLIVYTEIIKNERIAYEHSSGEEDDPGKFSAVITFEEQGNKTKLTMLSVFPSAAVRDMVVKEYGAIEGGNQTIDHLEQELLKM